MGPQLDEDRHRAGRAVSQHRGRRQLEGRGLGARRLDFLFGRVDNRWEAIRIGTARAERDARRLTRLLAVRIETIDPGFGIEVMTLTASLAEPLGAVQAISSLVEESEPDITGLYDLLANRIGERRLYRLAPAGSDVPERSVTQVEPLALDDGASWEDHWPRPALCRCSSTRPTAPPTVGSVAC